MTPPAAPTGDRPPDLGAWSGIEIIEPLRGGVRNGVWLARRKNRLVVARVSGRTPQALAWELDLLQALAGADVTVPSAIPTNDGRRHDQGVVVQSFVSGHHPRDERDWKRVVAALGVVHGITVGWPQRPGFASARDLLHQATGGDVSLESMPKDAVALVRAGWRPVLDARECAIHGDLGGGNVLIDGDRVGLIDWDEARVDVPAFDFAHLPMSVPVPVSVDRAILTTAGVAWEAATCWLAEPEYASRRLSELRERAG